MLKNHNFGFRNGLKPNWLILGMLGLSISLSGVVYSNTVIDTPVRGDTENQKKGFEIAAKSDRSDRGFVDSEVNLKMILTNKAGKSSTRDLSIKTLEIPDESVGDKSLVVFHSPRDVEGTALLSHAKILEPDDQWLYLPAIKRVKRISSSNKSGPFVGSEFAYEDFTSVELNKFDYEWVSEEPCGEFVCDVVKRFPRYKQSGYKKQISWIDQTHYQVRKIEFYDRRDEHFKTLEFSNYVQYGKHWRALKLRMDNHQTGKTTDLIYSDYKLDVGLSENEFVKSKLKRLK